MDKYWMEVYAYFNIGAISYIGKVVARIIACHAREGLYISNPKRFTTDPDRILKIEDWRYSSLAYYSEFNAEWNGITSHKFEVDKKSWQIWKIWRHFQTF